MIKYKTASKFRQLKPHLYKIGGKWDYEPAMGHELKAFANNLEASEWCFQMNRRTLRRRAKHISSISELNIAAIELLHN